ncbi:DUF3488 and transglutaminase-like domain-containing protein [Hydrogenimonas sp. SS33]|uniref:transglutaminase family protein n=1 Tax=Hydrogenimonas leucolamina TaxID=2954236 RepID=UPI00336BD99A
MRFSKPSRPTDTSSLEEKRALRLVDIALLSLLPALVPVLKLPMLLFLLLVTLALLAGKGQSAGAQLLIAMLGIVAIFLSLYGYLNMPGLSRLKLFVELMLYLLVLAVSLQRMTRRPNLYLVASPMLFLALLLFFYTSIPMLLYVAAELFLLLWLLLAWYMRRPLREALKTALLFYLAALPLVVLLFIFFPRISFGHASIGFRGESAKRTGLDGTMRLDAGALHLSDRIVMEVAFEKRIPPESALYFRGSVLYFDRGERWTHLPAGFPRRFVPVRYVTAPLVEEASKITIYKVTLYPTYKRWLYMLDLPIEAAEGASIDADFETTLKRPVTEPQIYSAASALRYRYGRATEKRILRIALDADAARNPKTAGAAEAIRNTTPDEEKRLEAILRFFRDANLTYTLRPPEFDMGHPVDSFLFDKKRGYCVHFAAAFATMARLAGLPARIVTGYKGSLENSVRNYLVVREKDAHAWVEVYMNRSWHRVETTATATRVAADAQTAVVAQSGSRREGSKARTGTGRLDLYLLYAKYRIETWILHYSRFRQMQLLDLAKKEKGFLLRFAGSLIVLVLVVASLLWLVRRPRCGTKADCILKPLMKRLQRSGCAREADETLHLWFRRCAKKDPVWQGLEEVDRLYHEIRFGGRKRKERELKKAVKKLLRR